VIAPRIRRALARVGLEVRLVRIGRHVVQMLSKVRP